MIDTKVVTSTRPYLIRALYEWCTENGLTPYIAVAVDDTVRVPADYVKDGEIVLNISFDATSSLQLGNDFIEFKARFGGVGREIVVPISRVIAIYARENGQGMTFPMLSASDLKTPGSGVSRDNDARRVESDVKLVPSVSGVTASGDESPDPDNTAGVTASRPTLKRVK